MQICLLRLNVYTQRSRKTTRRPPTRLDTTATLTSTFIFYFCLQQSFISTSIALLCIGSLTSAQFTYHLDANSNSYSVQTPNSQSHFEQYFNGQGPQAAAQEHGAGRQQQAAQTQHQVKIHKSLIRDIFLQIREC